PVDVVPGAVGVVDLQVDGGVDAAVGLGAAVAAGRRDPPVPIERRNVGEDRALRARAPAAVRPGALAAGGLALLGPVDHEQGDQCDRYDRQECLHSTPPPPQTEGSPTLVQSFGY